MKKYFISIILLALAGSALIGCKSKEEKAADLIKQELSKTLYDFESYKPIETTVKEAKANRYNDSICWKMGIVLAYGMQQVDEYIAEAKEATEYMAIYMPSPYSSSYSNRKFYDYNKKYEDAISNAKKGMDACKELAGAIEDTIAKLDTSLVIGWEVFHDFRCKTKGGNPTIGHFRYVISKDFKSVILREDMEGLFDKRIREALKNIETDWKEKNSN